MVDYAIANQIRPFQLPDIAGIANAMQGMEMNRMRSQQLQAAEQERNALRGLMADPNFDISSPEASRRILQVAPTIGGPAYNAALSGRRELRQSETAAAEAALKSFDISREMLRGIPALPEGDRQAAWDAWRARTETTVPGTRGFIPPAYSDDAFAAMISKADEIAKNLTERPTALAGPGNVPVFADRRTRTFQMGTEVPGAGVTAPPAAPAAAPRAEGPAAAIPAAATEGAPVGGPRAGTRPGMTPGQLAAANFLRGAEDYREAPYYDVTAYRAGYGSDTTTLADGRVVPVRQGMTISREDAERDLARRIPEFTQRAAANIGQEQFAALPPNAQAALISIAYNYGHIPESIRASARSGDLTALSRDVAALADNPSRRRQEAAMIAGGAAPNAMVAPRATTNAMLAPQDATAMNMPQLPTFAPPRTLAEADYQKRMMDMVADLEKKRIEAERRRGEQPERVQEAGQTSEAQRRGALTAEQERDERKKEEGRTNVNTTLGKMFAAYERLNEIGGIPSEARGTGGNIAAYAAGTPPGQAVGQALGTRAQSVRNELQSLARTLITDIKNSTGMSAQEMNSNVELQQMLAAVSSPTQSIESVRAIIQNLSERYGKGQTFAPAAPAQAPAAAPAARPAEGVPGPRRGATPPAGRPTLEQFLERARPANPNASIEDLTAYYNRTYGGR
jgi:GH24 family phage-related lysozyme (muramidase)